MSRPESHDDHWTNRDGIEYALFYPILFGVLYALFVIGVLLVVWAVGLIP